MCDLSGKIEASYQTRINSAFPNGKPSIFNGLRTSELIPTPKDEVCHPCFSRSYGYFHGVLPPFLSPLSESYSKSVVRSVVSGCQSKTNLNYFGLISFSRSLTFSHLFSIFETSKSVVRTSIISHFLIRQKSNFFSILAAV